MIAKIFQIESSAMDNSKLGIQLKTKNSIQMIKSICLGGLLILITSCNSNDITDPHANPDENKTVILAPEKSFSLLSLSADKGMTSGSYSSDKITKCILGSSPDIITLQDIEYSRSSSDIVTDIAYQISKNGLRRQGLFTAIETTDDKYYGVGVITKGHFVGTAKVTLSNNLILSTFEHVLESGDKITIATCQFDRESEQSRVQQAKSLCEYVSSINYPFVVSASIHAGRDSEVLEILKKKFRFSCKFNTGSTYPASNPTERYDFILTPLSQKWGTQGVNILGDESLSDHKALLIRVGLR